MKASLVRNSLNGRNWMTRMFRPRALQSIYNCMVSIVPNASSDIRWPGESNVNVLCAFWGRCKHIRPKKLASLIDVMKQEYFQRHNSMVFYTFKGAVACTSRVRSVNMNSATAATSRSKWALNVDFRIIVPNWDCIRIIHVTVCSICEIKNRRSSRSCWRLITSMRLTLPGKLLYNNDDDVICNLLQMNNVPFSTNPIEGKTPSEWEGARAKILCPMPIQKETPNGLVDTICNGDVVEQQAGLCR